MKRIKSIDFFIPSYLITACSSIRMLVKGFSPVILTREFVPSNGVDLAREERADRCVRCRSGFVNIRTTLEELKKSPGYVGVAVRDCLKELVAF